MNWKPISELPPLDANGYSEILWVWISNDIQLRARYQSNNFSKFRTECWRVDDVTRSFVYPTHWCLITPPSEPAVVDVDERCVWCKQAKNLHVRLTDKKPCPVDGVTSQFYTPPLKVKPDPAAVLATFLKCPKCDEGFAGTDHTGEAMDCHFCDGHGRITAAAYCGQHDRMQEIVGDNMAHEIRAEESRSVESALAEACQQARKSLDKHRCGFGSCHCCRSIQAIDAALETWKAGK